MKRIISLILALMLLTLPCAFAEEAASRLTVAGTATVSLPADTAVIRLGVQETAPEAQQAQATVNTKIAAIRQALLQMGIENADMTTESLYLYANYDYSDSLETLRSYTATNTLCITVRNIDLAADVIDAAFGCGANRFDDISFLASDISAATDQAYAEAVADAMHKAEIIAKAAGMNCISIVEINEGTTETWADNGMKLRATTYAAEDAAAGVDVQRSDVTVTANISITYSISK